LPVYGALTARHLRLTEFSGQKQPSDSGMGSGIWQQVRINAVSPLVVNFPVGVDVFADAEYRRIVTERFYPETPATIQSWRTGITFKLPLIGETYFSEDPSNDDESLEGPTRRGVRHRMDWHLTLSRRPTVR